MPTIFNAADEEAVSLFLDGRIGFLQIGEIVTETLQRMGDQGADTLEQVYAADAAARRTAQEIMEKL